MVCRRRPTRTGCCSIVQVLLANGLPDEALRRVRSWLPLFADSDCAPIRGTMAHAAYLAVESARRAGLPETEEVTKEADQLLGLMEGALDFPSQCSYLGYSVPVATALRAELHGEPSADLWRAAYDAAAHVGAGLALPIRLRLLGALLAEGGRDEVRTALPELARARLGRWGRWASLRSRSSWDVGTGSRCRATTGPASWTS